jgi:Na+/H+-dicarboxylate symporter
LKIALLLALAAALAAALALALALALAPGSDRVQNGSQFSHTSAASRFTLLEMQRR